MCLPECLCVRGSIKYPRGKYRARLGNLGLIGKIHLTSDMTVEEVNSEVCSVFKKPMSEKADFPFQYLQPMGTGSRCLTIPAVSSSFAWTAKQVARLGTSTGTIYILAKADLELDDEEEVLPSANTQYDHYSLQTILSGVKSLMMRGRTIKVSMMKGNVCLRYWHVVHIASSPGHSRFFLTLHPRRMAWEQGYALRREV